MVIGQLLAQQENAATEPDMDRGGGQTPEEEEKQIEEHVNSHQSMYVVYNEKVTSVPKAGRGKDHQQMHDKEKYPRWNNSRFSSKRATCSCSAP